MGLGAIEPSPVNMVGGFWPHSQTYLDATTLGYIVEPSPCLLSRGGPSHYWKEAW